MLEELERISISDKFSNLKSSEPGNQTLESNGNVIPTRRNFLEEAFVILL